MPTLTANITQTGSVGIPTYSWSITQLSGTGVSLSITTGSDTSIITYPSTLTYLPGASSGTYSYLVTETTTDPGVASCVQSKTISIFFNDTPPSCTLTLSSISIT